MSSKLIVALIIIVVILLVLNFSLWREVLFPKAAPDTVPGMPTRGVVATRTPTPSGDNTLPVAASPCPGGITPASNVLTTQEDVVAAARAGRHNVPFCVAAGEQQINDELTDYLSRDPNANFSEVVVDLQPGQAVITGKAHVLGLTFDTRATTNVVLVNGRPRLQVTKLEVLGATVPGLVRDRVAQLIEQESDLPILQEIPVRLDQVEVQDDRVLASGILL